MGRWRWWNVKGHMYKGGQSWLPQTHPPVHDIGGHCRWTMHHWARISFIQMGSSHSLIVHCGCSNQVPQTGGLTRQKVTVSPFCKLKVEDQVSASLVSCLSLWLVVTPFSRPNLFSEDTTHIRVGPTLRTLPYLHDLCKDPISTYSHNVSHCGLFSPIQTLRRWRPGWVLSENLTGASLPSDSFHYLQNTPCNGEVWRCLRVPSLPWGQEWFPRLTTTVRLGTPLWVLCEGSAIVRGVLHQCLLPSVLRQTALSQWIVSQHRIPVQLHLWLRNPKSLKILYRFSRM